MRLSCCLGCVTLNKAQYTGILFIRSNTLVFENNSKIAKNDLIITIKKRQFIY